MDVPSGDGLVYQTALAVESKNKNFLEGCYHLYTPHDQAFPGTVLSTGTEDCTISALLLRLRDVSFAFLSSRPLNRDFSASHVAVRGHGALRL